MKSNIEIKAHTENLHEIQKRINDIYGSDHSVLNQKDIYYRCSEGRLKLRMFSQKDGELISYRRENIQGPKKSRYSIYKTNNPGELNKALRSSVGIIGVVEKKRLVYITGQTRIHLDLVKNLGSFVELEVVLNEGQNDKEGEDIARDIMQTIGIETENLICVSYIDLLLQSNETQEV